MAIGPGNQTGIQVQIGKMVSLVSTPVQKLNLLLLGVSNVEQYLSTHGFCQGWADLLVSISGSDVNVVRFIVAFRYDTVNRQILIIVGHCIFWMYWPTLKSKYGDIHYLPHPGNETLWSIINFWSCILGNLSGD
jgi:hypothetical protein